MKPIEHLKLIVRCRAENTCQAETHRKCALCAGHATGVVAQPMGLDVRTNATNAVPNQRCRSTMRNGQHSAQWLHIAY